MKGMILAAGVGSRLNPITGVLPKPMVPVANKPVMEHIVEMLVRSGVTDIKANLHHLPHLVEQHFGSGERWGARLSYSLEKSLLGTAGAVKRVQRFFDETFVVTVADSVWDLDVRAVLDYHRTAGALATVVVKPMPIQSVGRFGVVRVDEEGRIREFQEKPNPQQACSNLASTGFYVLEPEVLDLVPRGEFFDFARDLFPRLLERNLPFHAFLYEGPWSDVGTFQEYLQVHRDILGGAYKRMLLPAREHSPGVQQGHHNAIHPEARLIPPVLLGSRCRIGRGAVIGPDAVLGDHAIVDEGARVAGSVVAAQTYVGRGIHLEECLAYKRWLVKLPSGKGLYVSDDTFLSGAGSGGLSRTLSRAVDMALGGLGLLGAVPLFVAIGVGARLSGQRVIERQWHLTPDLEAMALGGAPRMRPFQLLRFSPKGTVGKLAERVGVSRLPALYNVIRGDISLVGRKPLTAEEAALVPEEWQAHLCQAPAGLTGLWRIQGERLSLDEVLAVDAFYAASRSLGGDLKILWQTALRRNRSPGG